MIDLRRNDPHFVTAPHQAARYPIARLPDDKFAAHLAFVDQQIKKMGEPLALTWECRATLNGMLKERELLCSLRERLKKHPMPPGPRVATEDSLFKPDDFADDSTGENIWD